MAKWGNVRCRPKPETLKRRVETAREERNSRKGVRGAQRFEAAKGGSSKAPGRRQSDARSGKGAAGPGQRLGAQTKGRANAGSTAPRSRARASREGSASASGAGDWGAFSGNPRAQRELRTGRRSVEERSSSRAGRPDATARAGDGVGRRQKVASLGKGRAGKAASRGVVGSIAGPSLPRRRPFPRSRRFLSFK